MNFILHVWIKLKRLGLGIFFAIISFNRYNHTENVNSLFDKINIDTSPNQADVAWLSLLRREALKKTPGWKNTLDAYFRGLSSQIQTKKLCLLREHLSSCLDCEPKLFSLLIFPSIWLICATMALIDLRLFYVSPLLIIMLLVFLVITTCWWINNQPWLKSTCFIKDSPWERYCFIAMILGGAPLLIFTTPIITWDALKHFSVNGSFLIQGAMMHEFAHCLDTMRDVPTVQHTFQTYAIAPIDVNDITDLQSYVTVRERKSSQLWREALADVFTVGFWRLSTSPNNAKELITHWRKWRNDERDNDPTHITVCWTAQAMRVAPPHSYKELLTWAEQIRATAPCDIK